jgi:hypothetical protein
MDGGLGPTWKKREERGMAAGGEGRKKGHGEIWAGLEG